MIIASISAHGIGDVLAGLQINHFFRIKGYSVIPLVSARKEVFDPLSLLFDEIIKIDEKYSHENAILNSQELLDEIYSNYKFDYLNYHVPDLMYKNPLALPLDAMGLSIQIIKKHRLLINKGLNKEKIVYLGFSTSTDNYMYPYIKAFCKELKEYLPDYVLYFPKPNQWDKKIEYGDLDGIEKYVHLEEDPSFETSINILKRSEYGVFTCNGPSHLAYHLGIPRLILDPQFERIPWIARWKEDYEECINIDTDPRKAARLVALNVKIQQTQLIPRQKVLENLYTNWNKELIIKY